MAQDNTLDPVVILSALEAKVTALQALIASWKAAVAVGALGPVSDVPALSGGVAPQDVPTELPEGAFRNMSVPAAIKLYLSAVKKKQTPKEITAALKAGGMQSTSAKFDTVVTGSLNRLKVSGELLRFKDGWALAEHYNEHLRARLSDVKKHISKPAKRKRARSKAAPRAQVTARAVAPTGLKPKDRIVQVLHNQPGIELSLQDLANHLGMNARVVGMVLGKLIQKNRVQKTAAGKFRAAA